MMGMAWLTRSHRPGDFAVSAWAPLYKGVLLPWLQLTASILSATTISFLFLLPAPKHRLDFHRATSPLLRLHNLCVTNHHHHGTVCINVVIRKRLSIPHSDATTSHQDLLSHLKLSLCLKLNGHLEIHYCAVQRNVAHDNSAIHHHHVYLVFGLVIGLSLLLGPVVGLSLVAASCYGSS